MKYFKVMNGKLVTIRPWPKRLTKKRALELSIRKWEAVVETGWQNLAKNKDGGWKTCALCCLYIEQDPVCFGCPVAEHVDRTGCRGTPYELRYEDGPQLELDFLKKVYLDKYGETYP